MVRRRRTVGLRRSHAHGGCRCDGRLEGRADAGLLLSIGCNEDLNRGLQGNRDPPCISRIGWSIDSSMWVLSTIAIEVISCQLKAAREQKVYRWFVYPFLHAKFRCRLIRWIPRITQMQPPRLISKTLSLITLLAITSHAHARELEVPVRLNQALIHQYLVSQVYTEMDGTARIWHDGCNSLILSNPQVEVKAGVVRMTSAAQAQVGIAVGDNCLVMLNWTGFVDVLEQPVLSTEPGVVELWVIDSKVYSQDGESVGITGTVWDWIKQYAHPRLERMKLDLNPTLDELESLLPLVFPNDQVFARHLLDSVKLSKVQADDGQCHTDHTARHTAAECTDNAP
jgi:hypothetical protein